MRVDRLVLSHEWIIMDTNITEREREVKREREKKKKKKKVFHIIVTFILRFIKYTV